MSPMKVFVAAASLAALCGSTAIAEQPSDKSMTHEWHKPSADEMAAWHAHMCNDRYAHEAGRLAYLEASLSVTDAQRGAFDQWRDAVLNSAKSHSAECLAHTQMPDHVPSVLERNAMMQKMLESKLAALQSERPALEALYQSLTPEQKKLFDREGGHFGHHHGHGMGFGFHRDGDDHHDHG